MKSWIKYLTTVTIILAIILTGIFRERVYQSEWFSFDTIIKVKLLSRNPFRAKRCIEEIKSAFTFLDSIGSNLIDKPLYSPLLAKILKEALDISRITDGAFDPTIGIIEKEWKRFKEPVIPDSEKILSLLKFVDYRKVRIRNDTIIPVDGQIIDLGGIAKGFALDTAKAIIKSNGIKSGLVYAGGDIILIGGKGKRDWVIGVRDPRNNKKIIEKLQLKDLSIATSGDYERYFFINGKRYHHILDPRTGYPASECVSVTVVGKTGMKADALATGIFVLGPKRGMELARKLGLRVLIVDKNLKRIEQL